MKDITIVTTKGTINGTKKNMGTLGNQGPSVCNVYVRPSSAKINAENRILTSMEKVGGHGYRVTGHNSCTFSAAWLVEGYDEDDTTKTEKTWVIYETHVNRYIYEY